MTRQPPKALVTGLFLLAASLGCGRDPEPGAVSVTFEGATRTAEASPLVTSWAFIRIAAAVRFAGFAAPYRYELAIDGVIVAEETSGGALLHPVYVWETADVPAGAHTVTVTGIDGADGRAMGTLDFQLVDRPGVVDFELASSAPEDAEVVLLDPTTEAVVARTFVDNPFDVATAEFGPTVFETTDGLLDGLSSAVVVEVRWSEGGNAMSERLGEATPGALGTGLELTGTLVRRLRLANVRFGSSDPDTAPGRPFCDYAPFC